MRNLAQTIVDVLNTKGAGLGNISVLFVEDVLETELAQAVDVLRTCEQYADDCWWLDREEISQAIALISVEEAHDA